MFFHVRDLEVRAKQFDVEVATGVIDYQDAKLRQAGALEAEGKAELVTGALGEIRVSGRLAVLMGADCDRCLEPAEFPIDSNFDLFYRPAARAGTPRPLARSGPTARHRGLRS